MSKSKKKKPAEPPRVLRGYPMPKNLLWKIANDIYGQKSDVETIYNTLKDLYCQTYTKSYLRCLDDANRFRMAREATIKDIFDAIYERTDDIVHKGVVTNKTN